MSDSKTPKQPSERPETGYCKPPQKSRFQPGKSGNPKGRPRKNKPAEPENRTKVHEEEMNELVSIRNADGKMEKMTIRRLMYKTLKQQALQQKDIKAMKELLKLEEQHAAFTAQEGAAKGGVLLIPELINLDGSPVTNEQWLAHARLQEPRLREEREAFAKELGLKP